MKYDNLFHHQEILLFKSFSEIKLNYNPKDFFKSYELEKKNNMNT